MAKYIVVHSIKVATEFIPETFGRLTTIGPWFLLPTGSQGKRKRIYQVCVCLCGNTHVTARSSLLEGHTSSCGCLKRESDIRKFTKHGKYSTPECQAIYNIKRRCYNTHATGYKDYGGRGITVCDRWLDPDNALSNLLEDLGERPSDKHSIERKDVNGNYCPENCYWATRVEQARNRRCNVYLTYNGKTQCLAAWSEETGIPFSTLKQRVRKKTTHGWSDEDVLTKPKFYRENKRNTQ